MRCVGPLKSTTTWPSSAKSRHTRRLIFYISRSVSAWIVFSADHSCGLYMDYRVFMQLDMVFIPINCIANVLSHVRGLKKGILIEIDQIT